jgi:hypothetical protein
MNKTHFNGGISGGAIVDIELDRATKHAEKYYGFIRSISYDIDYIAANTEFTKEQIELVKKPYFL